MHSNQLQVLSIGPAAREWLELSRRPRWLHVFDHVCNLINERNELISVVHPNIGEGPFNLVLEDNGVRFRDLLHVRSPIVVTPEGITLGGIRIEARNAAVSSTRPDWESLHSHRERIISELRLWTVLHVDASIPIGLSTALFGAIARGDIPASVAAARRLAGLGRGLTPAGDDILLGGMLAAWILHPTGAAVVLAEAMANAAAPLTTALSAAWLRAAGIGQAENLWHEFFNALLSEDTVAIHNSVRRISSVGHTSGCDALTGFLGSLTFRFHSYDLSEYVL